MDKRLLTSIVLVILFITVFFVVNKFMLNTNYMMQDSNINMINSNTGIKVIPIEHASMVLEWGDKIIYVDPVGDMTAFANQSSPDIILLTHTHGDHFNVDILKTVAKDKTLIVAPMVVADMMPHTVLGTLLVAKNGQKTTEQGFNIEVVPAYNLLNAETTYHPKGEGNGYVLEKDGKRVYISGDTANIPELRDLNNIDMAFVCMNLPYTMSIEDAVDAVLSFSPKQVYPYHYRTPDGFSDVSRFKELINNQNPNIEVVQLNWYAR